MVHNFEHSYMTSRSIYMRARVPSTKPLRGATVELIGHPGVAVMTGHITKPTPLPAVVKWPRSWTVRSNHHFTGMLV